MASIDERDGPDGRGRQAISLAALRELLNHKPKDCELPPLPEFSSGGMQVDIANRDMLYDAMER